MSMISSTPLNKENVDPINLDIPLTPIAYEDLQKQRTRGPAANQDDATDKFFTQVKLDENHELYFDETTNEYDDKDFGSPVRKNGKDELRDWRKNSTKRTYLASDSTQKKKSTKFSASLPYDESYLPDESFDKKIMKYRKEIEERQQQQQVKKPVSKGSGAWSNVYKLISDPSIPYTLSLYLQLILNAVIIGFIILFIYTFVSTIRNDVQKRTDEMTFKLLKEISVCAKEYDRNNCAPSERVPAAEKACRVWEHCMNQDPTSVGQVKISFEILAEILNGFVRLLSWKTIFVLVVLVVGSLVVTNLVFDRYRYNNYQPAPPSQSQPAPLQAAAQAVVIDDRQFKSPYTGIVRRDLGMQSPTVRFSDYSNNRPKWE